MRTAKDLTGERFGRLVVIRRSSKRANNVTWNCVCDCGKETNVFQSCLVQGSTESCGCLHKEKIKEIRALSSGDRINNIVLIQHNPSAKSWECKCDCGKLFITSHLCLMQREVISCGCVKIKYKFPLIRSRSELVAKYPDLSETEEKILLMTELKKLSLTEAGRELNVTRQYISLVRKKVFNRHHVFS